MYADHVQRAEQELYKALEALEVGNLTFARRCTACAQTEIVSAWRSRDKELQSEHEQQIECILD